MSGEQIHTTNLDMRQIKTRKALSNAFISLLQERDYDHISVSDITGRAGVSRPTFYLHYNDKSEVLLARLEEIFSILEQLHIDTGASHSTDSRRLGKFIDSTLDVISKNERFFSLLVSGNAGTTVNRAIRDEMELLLSRFIESVYKRNRATATLPMVASFYAGGLQGLIATWLESGMEPPRDKMSALILQLFEEDYRVILKS